MTSYRFPNPHEPSEPDLEPELRDLDEKLAETFGRREAPEGLADRIFRASVGSLRTRARLAEQTVGAERGMWRRLAGLRRQQAWGRLALAASLALACVVAATLLRVPSVTTPGPSGDVAATAPPTERFELANYAYLQSEPAADEYELAGVLKSAWDVSLDGLDAELSWSDPGTGEL
jgi:hypothetical protein